LAIAREEERDWNSSSKAKKKNLPDRATEWNAEPEQGELDVRNQGAYTEGERFQGTFTEGEQHLAE